MGGGLAIGAGLVFLFMPVGPHGTGRRWTDYVNVGRRASDRILGRRVADGPAVAGDAAAAKTPSAQPAGRRASDAPATPVVMASGRRESDATHVTGPSAGGPAPAPAGRRPVPERRADDRLNKPAAGTPA
jgi:hypothetical protein